MIIKTVDSDNKTLNNLLQIYEKEFSKITKKTPNKDGRFDLDVDLKSTDNFLLYLDDEAIGFCIKGISDNRHDIYEFYITPSMRHKKLGRNFAKEIFKKYKGSWQVRQIEGAHKAISFWRKAISEFTDSKYNESIVEDQYWGKVTKQVFNSL